MRPLWRNTLWLAFAAACGALGYWQGIGKGAEVIGSIAGSNDAAESLANVSRAMQVLDREPGNAYAGANLRSALFRLGANEKALEGWWTCREADPAVLARARRYLHEHPAPSEPQYDDFIRRGLQVCELVQRKAE